MPCEPPNNLALRYPTKRTIIAFDVDDKQVSIIAVFYGGQDYEIILQENPDPLGND
jgi:plasmid stabilization system protein ParE